MTDEQISQRGANNGLSIVESNKRQGAVENHDWPTFWRETDLVIT